MTILKELRMFWRDMKVLAKNGLICIDGILSVIGECHE